jgi:5,10-methylene-tetrahydrofolate dehydrogenase/methenyl tetrahydrofolate cyclohydrolase
MILIDGKKVAAELREELKQEVLELKTKYNKVPGLNWRYGTKPNLCSYERKSCK